MLRTPRKLGHTVALSALLLASCSSLGKMSIAGSNTPTYDSARPQAAQTVSLGERRRPTMNPGAENAPMRANAADTGWADQDPRIAAGPGQPVSSPNARRQGWSETTNGWSSTSMTNQQETAGWADQPIGTAPAAQPASVPVPGASVASVSGLERRRPALNDQAPGNLPMAASNAAAVEPVQTGNAYPNLASVPQTPPSVKSSAQVQGEIRQLEAAREQALMDRQPGVPGAPVLPSAATTAPDMPPAALPQAHAMDEPKVATSEIPLTPRRELPPIELKAPPAAAPSPAVTTTMNGVPVTFSDEPSPTPQTVAAIPAGQAIPAAQVNEMPQQSFDVQEATVASVEPIQLTPPQEEVRGTVRPSGAQVRKLLPESRYAAIRRKRF